MLPFFVLVTAWGVYAKTKAEFEARPPPDAYRWHEVTAGTRGQALGIGWQLRHVPDWRPNYRM